MRIRVIVRTTFERTRHDARFHLVSNPEFLREGTGVYDSLELGWEPKVPLDIGLERMVA